MKCYNIYSGNIYVFSWVLTVLFADNTCIHLFVLCQAVNNLTQVWNVWLQSTPVLNFVALMLWLQVLLSGSPLRLVNFKKQKHQRKQLRIIINQS